MKRALLFLFPLALLFASCDQLIQKKNSSPVSDESRKEENNRANGTVKYYYKSGKLKSIVHYRDSLKTGMSETYYETGEKQYEIPYTEGMKDGVVKWFYKSGEIYRETPFVRGKKNGIRKTYWENGQLKAEALFKDDMAGIGLKEYSNLGKPKEIPYIIIEAIDRTTFADEYILKFRLSDGTKKVSFYIGKLIDGKYLPNRFSPDLLPVETKNGVGFFKITIPKGRYIMKTINIVADKSTYYKNHLVLTREYNLSVKNEDI